MQIKKLLIIVLVVIGFPCTQDKTDGQDLIDNLTLEIDEVGYTYFKVKLNNLNANFTNEVYLISKVDSLGNFLHTGTLRKLIESQYANPEILISGLPLTIFET